MSRIGKKPIAIPSGVTVRIDGQTVTVHGPKGELKRTFHPNVTLTQKEGTILVGVSSNEDGALWGLSRQLFANMVEGVTKQYTKRLELVGVGYRAGVAGQKLTLHIGFSHQVDFPLSEGITATVEKNTLITLMGADKELLGNIAASIRALRKPEPYKGKGIRYVGEVVRRKLGKAAKAAGGAGAGAAG